MISAEYAAGFFDGEATVSIINGAGKGKKVSRPNQSHYILTVSAVNSNPKPLKLLKERWGGNIYSRAGDQRASCFSKKTMWSWQISAQRAARFLIDILPYLCVKIEQAEAGIALAANIHSFHAGRSNPVPAAMVSYRTSLKDKVMEANKREYPDVSVPVRVT